jgi:signal transduction histidine kinase
MVRSGEIAAANPVATPRPFGSGFHQLSHDLRTPLNAINGYAELLLMDDGLSPAQAEYVRAILSGGEALSAAVTGHLNRAEVRAAPSRKRSPLRRIWAARARGAKRRVRHLTLQRTGQKAKS